MPNEIVINTGPLIALAAGDVLHLLKELPFDFIVPQPVVEEIEVGKKQGHLSVSFEDVRVVSSPASQDPVIVSLLDKGEASVIQYALENGIETVCIDEKKGRNLARGVDLAVVGTLGLLLKAKRVHALEEIGPVINRLMSFGIWYDRKLLDRVLTAAGEINHSANMP